MKQLAYLHKDACITKAALAVAGIDTLVGIVAGLVIMSVVLVGVSEPGSTLELVFEAIPFGFDQLAWGRVPNSGSRSIASSKKARASSNSFIPSRVRR